MRAGIVLFLSLAACKSGGPDDPLGGTPVAVWAPEALDFGVVPLGETAELTFEISNDGSGTLELYTVIVADGEEDVWDVSWDNSNRALLAGESQVVTVFFSPDEADRRFGGRVQVRTSDVEATSFFLIVEGEGAPSNADNDGDGVTVSGGDCDDDNADVYPGAPELCNGRDDDCQGGPNANEADDDGDGVRLCESDCDDNNSDVYPGAPEICDGLDSDCDGVNQDNADADADGLSVCDGDCDDSNPSAYPGNPEVCGDGADNDCDGTADSIDADGDGHDVCAPVGADCDDGDPLAYPLFVSENGAGGAAGTPADPLDSIGGALAALDAVCRTVYVEPGNYGVSGETWSAGDLSIVGLGATPDEVVFDGGGARQLDISGGAVTITGVHFSGGQAPAGQSGGAVRVTGGSFTAVDCEFVGNAADGSGGAIYASNTTLSLQQGCLFDSNQAANGGAVAVDNATFFDPNGSSFVANTASADGGGMHALGSTLFMTGTGFDSNTAITGGGLFIDGGGGHLVQRGLYYANVATTSAAAHITGTGGGVWRNNYARDNDGGAVTVTGGAVFSVLNNTFTSNVGAAEGVVISVDSDSATVLANLGHFNDGPSGIYAPIGSLAVVTHNTVFATSTNVDFGGAVVVDINNNTSQNPGFVSFTDDGDPSNDDLALQATSPVVDTGPPDVAYNDTDGSQNDRGATGGPGGQ